jgi:hypothetical protein
VLGVDFTSSPRIQKPITVARGTLADGVFRLDAIDSVTDWVGFETILATPGPWIGGFDFPFGLPREAVVDLGWPREWPTLVEHCARLGRAAFRTALDRYRESRPFGSRYAHRATDMPARSHSPLKLVNPPVGLMFLEGAPRLLRAGVHVPGLAAGDRARVALEAYPGLAARALLDNSARTDHKQALRAESYDQRGQTTGKALRAESYDQRGQTTGKALRAESYDQRGQTTSKALRAESYDQRGQTTSKEEPWSVPRHVHSYKSDDRAKQTPARRRVRAAMVATLVHTGGPFGFTLAGDRGILASLTHDASGDRLDAVLAAMQAAWAARRRARNFGLPRGVDPLEGWILMAPHAAPHAAPRAAPHATART